MRMAALVFGAVVLALSSSTKPASCHDMEASSRCRLWFEANECKNAPSFMAVRCPQTCNLCGYDAKQLISNKSSTPDEEMLRGEFRSSIRCQENPTRRATAFVYVGSDVDITPLDLLHCQETVVVFIDPLVFWRNARLIDEYVTKHGMNHAPTKTRFPGSSFSDFDSFFECPPDCDPVPLTNTDLLRIAGRLAKGLTFRPCRTKSSASGGAAARAPETGLSGFILHGQSIANVSSEVTSGRVPAITFDFETQGVRRTFEYYTTAAENLTLSHILKGHPLSTVVYAGASSSHGILEAACGGEGSHPPYIGEALRIFSKRESFSDTDSDIQSNCGPLRRHAPLKQFSCPCVHTPCLVGIELHRA
jgi:hypothetical protein